MTTTRSMAAARSAVLAALSALVLAVSLDIAVAESAADEREDIVLSSSERAEMLRGMRLYLESIERIVSGMSSNKMPEVASGASASGMKMLSDVSILTAAKLPIGFIQMATDTHQKFDALSETALKVGTKLVVMQHLAGILANCTSCHAMYRIAP